MGTNLREFVHRKVSLVNSEVVSVGTLLFLSGSIKPIKPVTGRTPDHVPYFIYSS